MRSQQVKKQNKKPTSNQISKQDPLSQILSTWSKYEKESVGVFMTDVNKLTDRHMKDRKKTALPKKKTFNQFENLLKQSVGIEKILCEYAEKIQEERKKDISIERQDVKKALDTIQYFKLVILLLRAQLNKNLGDLYYFFLFDNEKKQDKKKEYIKKAHECLQRALKINQDNSSAFSSHKGFYDSLIDEYAKIIAKDYAILFPQSDIDEILSLTENLEKDEAFKKFGEAFNLAKEKNDLAAQVDILGRQAKDYLAKTPTIGNMPDDIQTVDNLHESITKLCDPLLTAAEIVLSHNHPVSFPITCCQKICLDLYDSAKFLFIYSTLEFMSNEWEKRTLLLAEAEKNQKRAEELSDHILFDCPDRDFMPSITEAIAKLNIGKQEKLELEERTAKYEQEREQREADLIKLFATEKPEHQSLVHSPRRNPETNVGLPNEENIVSQSAESSESEEEVVEKQADAESQPVSLEDQLAQLDEAERAGDFVGEIIKNVSIAESYRDQALQFFKKNNRQLISSIPESLPESLQWFKNAECHLSKAMEMIVNIKNSTYPDKGNTEFLNLEKWTINLLEDITNLFTESKTRLDKLKEKLERGRQDAMKRLGDKWYEKKLASDKARALQMLTLQAPEINRVEVKIQEMGKRLVTREEESRRSFFFNEAQDERAKLQEEKANENKPQGIEHGTPKRFTRSKSSCSFFFPELVDEREIKRTAYGRPPLKRL